MCFVLLKPVRVRACDSCGLKIRMGLRYQLFAYDDCHRRCDQDIRNQGGYDPDLFRMEFRRAKYGGMIISRTRATVARFIRSTPCEPLSRNWNIVNKWFKVDLCVIYQYRDPDGSTHCQQRCLERQSVRYHIERSVAQGRRVRQQSLLPCALK